MLSATEGDLYLDTVANDPTLMEMSVTMASITQASATSMTQATASSMTQVAAPEATPAGLVTPTSQNAFKSKGKWLSPSEEIRLGAVHKLGRTTRGVLVFWCFFCFLC